MSKKQHYVDNKEFLAAMIEWKESIREGESEGDEIPPITEYIGECFYKIRYASIL